MKTETYTNRYNDKFTFTLLEDGNIQWDGKFEHCRFAFPNDYSKAYRTYFEAECIPPHDHTLSFEQFKEAIHEFRYDENGSYIGKTKLQEKYSHLVKSRTDTICMVDPSGGPYLSEGMELMGKTIKEFKPKENGYLIITK
jgi:hypothetical protein